ncbi:MAG: ADP-ribosylglycohydrolase family protein, partial [Proteobacteria bacterium]|nr:ADP-ribosylglycohydrolase family protein [Pseudomonadota bacterium]
MTKSTKEEGLHQQASNVVVDVVHAERLDRAQGCLLGQIAGDSLGSLVEFQSAPSIRRRYPGGVRQLEDGGHWNTLAGQPTDDSELALELAHSLIECGRFDEDAVAGAYAHWYQSGPFDCGGTIGQALSAVAAFGKDSGVAEAARRAGNRGSQANGALMRVSPLGIFGWNTAPDVLARWAASDASLTHPNPLCASANEVFVIAIAAAIRDGGNKEDVFDTAWDWAVHAGYDDIVQLLAAARDEPPPECDGEYIGWV